MKLTDRELAYDDGMKVYIGRRQFRSTDGTLKFSDTWSAEFYQDGKQRRVSLGVRTRLHAIKEAQKLAEGLATGTTTLAERRRTKVGEIVEKYLAYQRAHDRAPKTMEKYEYVLRNQFQPWWEKRGDKPASAFRADDYFAFKQRLTDDGMQLKTVADRLMIVRQMFKWAATRSDPPLLPRYPLANVGLVKVPEKQQPCFTPDQVRMILDNADPVSRPVYATLAYTGMRFGEVRDLQWSDIDLRGGGGVIHVRRGGSRRDTTKSGRSRQIPINRELHAVLSALPRLGERVFFHPPTRQYPDGARPLEETDFLRRFKRLCKRIGLADWKGLKLHTFRHFFASICAKNNVSYKFALRWMGHRNSNILDLYFHMYDREAQQAMIAYERTDAAGRPQRRSRLFGCRPCPQETVP